MQGMNMSFENLPTQDELICGLGLKPQVDSYLSWESLGFSAKQASSQEMCWSHTIWPFIQQSAVQHE